MLSRAICDVSRNLFPFGEQPTDGLQKVMLDKVPILLAEDDENDIFLMGRAFDRAGIPNPLFVVRNGQEAIDYLAGTGMFAQRSKYPLPGLMLLDLKMPWMDGFDVLKWLRSQHQFDNLPVVVLTSSKLQSDIDRTRDMGVYDYRVKPLVFEDLVRLLDDVRNCWLDERVNRSGANGNARAEEGVPSPAPGSLKPQATSARGSRPPL